MVGPDIDLGVDHLAEGLAQLDELLLAALPRQVAHVQHLGRRLRVAELGLTGGGRHGEAGCTALQTGAGRSGSVASSRTDETKEENKRKRGEEEEVVVVEV